jgi:methylenetetrahydrofolate reductase (NADPH)
MADYSILIYLVVALSMIMVGVSKGGGLHEKAFILVGVGPLRSERAAEFMRTKVPGVIIPDVLVEPLRKTPKRHKRAEGKRICVEIIQQVREIEGVAGVHVMAYRHEELVAEIVDEAKLLPRPGRRDIVRPRNQRSSNRIRGN